MDAYVSEVSYDGTVNDDFYEFVLPAGTDPTGWSVVFYSATGTMISTMVLPALASSIAGQDVYVYEKGAGAPQLSAGDGIALVDDLGTVVHFVSFGGPEFTAINGGAAGMTSTDIGSATGANSLATFDDGATYQEQVTPTPGTVPCMAEGTRIATPTGLRAIETLRPGDLISCHDGHSLPLLLLRRKVQALPRALPAHKRPVLIRAGALGDGRPAQDVIVSPQHRILCGSAGQLPWLYAEESLVPARTLLGLPRVRAMMGKRSITWWHLVLPQHALILAEGMVTETLLPGPQITRSLSAIERTALGPARDATPVRPILRPQTATRLLETQQARAERTRLRKRA